MLLRRGRSIGNFPKAEMTLDELVQMMAGGAELEQLGHELKRDGGSAGEQQVARELSRETEALGITEATE